MPTILLIGTLDTKGMEFAFVRDLIVERGHQTIVIDAGISAEPVFPPDITAEAVAEAGGTTLTYLREAQDRGAAISAMSAGAAKLTAQLYAAGQIDGILSLGGSGGTSIASAAMQALPVGFPKGHGFDVDIGGYKPLRWREGSDDDVFGCRCGWSQQDLTPSICQCGGRNLRHG